MCRHCRKNLTYITITDQLPEGSDDLINKWYGFTENLITLQQKPSAFLSKHSKEIIHDLFYTPILSGLDILDLPENIKPGHMVKL